MNVNNLKVGQELLLNGDMANLSGHGRIVRTYKHERFGVSYDVLLDDERIFNRVQPVIIKSGKPWVLIYEEPNKDYCDAGKQVSQEEKIIKKTGNTQLFDSGKFLLTKGVSAKVDKDEEFHDFINKSLKHHISGDWGEISPEDAQSNQDALEQRLRLISAYSDPDNVQIWIITEAERFATTVLFPGEY